MSETRPSDSCRICKSSFKLKFGSLTGKQFYSSSQNLFKPSQGKDSFGIVLADVCRQVGLVLLQDPEVYLANRNFAVASVRKNEQTGVVIADVLSRSPHSPSSRRLLRRLIFSTLTIL